MYARNKRGRSQVLVLIPQAKNVSSTASSRTIRKRSSVTEHVITKISRGSDANKEDQNIKNIIVVSARKAGMKIVSKFDIKDVVALKAEMPMAQIRPLVTHLALMYLGQKKS